MYAKPTIIILLSHDCEKCNVFRQRKKSVIVGWCQTISSWKANDFQMLYVSIRAPFCGLLTVKVVRHEDVILLRNLCALCLVLPPTFIICCPNQLVL